MKTLAKIIALFMVAFGVVTVLVNHNIAGVVPIIIGALGFLILVWKTKKIAGYNQKSFMNR